MTKPANAADATDTADVADAAISTSAGSLMQAWQIRAFGPDGLERAECPVPPPGPYELLVKIGAVSLNYRDWPVIDGSFDARLPLPFVPASDAAGTVVATGPGVTRFRTGDRVTTHFTPTWIDGDVRSEENSATLGGPSPACSPSTSSSTSRRWWPRRRTWTIARPLRCRSPG